MSLPEIHITGYSRSGTTMLAASLSKHLKATVTPETHFFYEYLDYNRKNIDLDKQLDVKEAINYFYNNKRIIDLVKKKDLMESLGKKEEISILELFSIALNIFQKKHGENNEPIIEKSPAHILEYNRITKYNKNAKFIFIVRDPRDVIFSLLNVKWTHHNVYRHMAEWAYQLKLALRLQKQNPEKILIVHFEEYISEQNLYLENISKFSGMAKRESEVNNSIVPSWESEWKSSAINEVNQDHKFLWKKKVLPTSLIVASQQYSTIIKKIGYEVLPGAKTATFKNYIPILMFNKYLYPLFRSATKVARKFFPRKLRFINKVRS